MSQKQTKETDEIRKWVVEHQVIAGVIERLLDAGWLDGERIADLVASHLLENPYRVDPKKMLIEKSVKK